MEKKTAEDFYRNYYALEQGDLSEDAKNICEMMDEFAASLNRQGWTRVEDGLPDEEDDVIVYMSKMGHGSPGSAYVGVYEKGKWKIVDTIDGIIQDANNNPDYWIVTHWMPLPNKPI